MTLISSNWKIKRMVPQPNNFRGVGFGFGGHTWQWSGLNPDSGITSGRFGQPIWDVVCKASALPTVLLHHSPNQFFKSWESLRGKFTGERGAVSFIYHPTGNSTGLRGRWIGGIWEVWQNPPLLGNHPWSPLATRSEEGSHYKRTILISTQSI